MRGAIDWRKHSHSYSHVDIARSRNHLGLQCITHIPLYTCTRVRTRVHLSDPFLQIEQVHTSTAAAVAQEATLADECSQLEVQLHFQQQQVAEEQQMHLAQQQKAQQQAHHQQHQLPQGSLPPPPPQQQTQQHVVQRQQQQQANTMPQQQQQQLKRGVPSLEQLSVSSPKAHGLDRIDTGTSANISGSMFNSTTAAKKPRLSDLQSPAGVGAMPSTSTSSNNVSNKYGDIGNGAKLSGLRALPPPQPKAAHGVHSTLHDVSHSSPDMRVPVRGAVGASSAAVTTPPVYQVSHSYGDTRGQAPRLQEGRHGGNGAK